MSNPFELMDVTSVTGVPLLCAVLTFALVNCALLEAPDADVE